MSNNIQRGVWMMNPETPQIVQPKGEKYMKRVKMILSASGLVLALSMPSWAQVKVLPTETVTIAGTVETIDQAKRVLNIKTATGEFVAVDVPESAKRFAELKVGDKVKATYNNNVMARLKEPGEPAVNTESTGKVVNTGEGTRPGGTAVLERIMTVTVAAIDKSASSITFVGPNEWKYSRRVVDPMVLDTLKVGDRVDITWNTDVTVSVESLYWNNYIEVSPRLCRGTPGVQRMHRGVTAPLCRPRHSGTM